MIEAFARGRGVVAAGVGGIPDLVRNEVEGLLIDPTDTPAITDALVRVLADRELAERFGEAATARYREWDTTPVEYASQVRELVDATLRDAGAVRAEKPRVLIVGDEPPSAEALRALRDELDYCVVGRAEPGVEPKRSAVGPGSVHLVSRFLYGPRLPVRVRSFVRRFRPEVVIAESPMLGISSMLVGLAFRRQGDRPSLVVETRGRLARRQAAPARAPGGSSRRSSTGRRATRCAAPTRCAPSRRTRPGSPSTRPACRRSSRSRRTSTCRSSPARRGSRCPTRRRPCSSGCSRRTRTVDGLAEAWRRWVAMPRCPTPGS